MIVFDIYSGLSFVQTGIIGISARYFVYALVHSVWPFLLTEGLGGMQQYQTAGLVEYVAIIAPTSLTATAIRQAAHI